MNHHYSDITDKLGEPKWWDEHAVPRYRDFAPGEVANIYASQVVLLRIACQNCGREFLVAMSCTAYDAYGWIADRDWRHTSGEPLTAVHGELPLGSLSGLVEADEIHYGDPPHAGCCPAGPTMNSVPREVVEFWERDPFDWTRRPELERAIRCDWAEGT